MKRIADWYEKKRKTLWFCILFNLAMFGFFMLIMRPMFDTNDDIAIASFVNRGKPIQDVHLLFENVIVGYVCAFLYRVTNMLPWYGLLQYFGMFCAFTGMTWAVQQLFRKSGASVICLIFLNFFAADAYTRVQFTKTAGICAACGLFLIVYAMTRERVPKTALVFGILIALYGYLYRDREAYIMAMLWCVFGLMLLLRLREIPRGLRLRRAGRYFGCFFMVAAACAAAYGINEMSYKKDPEAESYRELEDLRSQITDYGFPDYEENRELFESVGISKSAYTLFSKWNFYDPDVFTVDVQRKILAARKQKELNGKLLSDFFNAYPLKWFENPMFYGFLITALFAALYGKKGRETWPMILVLFAVILGLCFIMFWSGRYNVRRVDNPMWLCAAMILLFLIDPGRFTFSGRFALTLIFAVFIMDQHDMMSRWRHYTVQNAAQMKTNANLHALISRDTEHLYLSKEGVYSEARAYGPWSLVPVGVGANACAFGGWTAGSPVYCSVIGQYGVTNPYRDCINNEKVYIIDDRIDRTLNYIHEYYDADARSEVVGDYDGTPIYRIVSP